MPVMSPFKHTESSVVTWLLLRDNSASVLSNADTFGGKRHVKRFCATARGVLGVHSTSVQRQLGYYLGSLIDQYRTRLGYRSEICSELKTSSRVLKRPSSS